MGCGTSMNDNDIKDPHSQSQSQSQQHQKQKYRQNTKSSQQQITIKIRDSDHNIITDNKGVIDLKQIKTQKSINNQQSSTSLHIYKREEQEMQQEQKHTNARMYLFGQSKQQRKVVQFQALPTPHIQILLSRTHNPPPVKYQPPQIILQQSQELTNSNLYLSTSHPPYNYMYATFIKYNTIFLCGGVNFQFDNVSDQAFLYNIKDQPSNINTPMKNDKGANVNANGSAIHNKKPRRIGNNLMGSKFERLSYMKNKRYSHIGVFYRTGKLGYIYVFGGRTQSDQILDKCQKYSISENKWTQIAPLSMPRSTGFAIIVNKKIYVFGGYNSQGKRSKKIQRYNPDFNSWDILSVKLHKGIETGILLPCPTSNQILIVGGNVEFGAIKSVIRVNFQNQTYVWDSDLKKQRLLQKGIALLQQNSAYVLGGDFEDTIQKYSYKDKTWKIVSNLTYGGCVSPDDINAFTLAQQSIQLSFQTNQNKSILQENDALLSGDYRFIFGSDDYPCIYELNTSKWVLKKKNVPMALRLRSYMSSTKIKEGKIFIAGGIDCYNEKASRAAFIYYPGTNKAIEISKMKQKKYGFSCCYINNFVYIFGGQTGKQGTVLNIAEKYDISEDKWIQLPEMPRERTLSRAILSSNNKILLIGGTDCLYQSVPQIDIFDPQTDTFTQFDLAFPLACQIKFVDFTGKTSVRKNTNKGSGQFEFLDDESKNGSALKIQQVPKKQEQKLVQKNEQKTHNLSQVTSQEDLEHELLVFGYNSYKKEDQAYFITISTGSPQQISYDEKPSKLYPYSLTFTVKSSQKSTQKLENLPSQQNSKQSEKQQNYYFISNKGVFKWQTTNKQITSQIVINQIHLLQMPLEKFSIV